MTKPEGVAAPLEPTTLEQIEPSTRTVASGHLHYLDMMGKGTMTLEPMFTFKERNFAGWAYIVAHPSKLLDCGFKSVQQFLRELCEAYAAAVSKNWRE